MIDREWITEVGNRLEFVIWDRVIIYDDLGYAGLYGWIPREDGRSDFVFLQFWERNADRKREWNWATSSTEFSPIINEIHNPGAEHNDCRIVQNELPGLFRKVDR